MNTVKCDAPGCAAATVVEGGCSEEWEIQLSARGWATIGINVPGEVAQRDGDRSGETNAAVRSKWYPTWTSLCPKHARSVLSRELLGLAGVKEGALS